MYIFCAQKFTGCFTVKVESSAFVSMIQMTLDWVALCEQCNTPNLLYAFIDISIYKIQYMIGFACTMYIFGEVQSRMGIRKNIPFPCAKLRRCNDRCLQYFFRFRCSYSIAFVRAYRLCVNFVRTYFQSQSKWTKALILQSCACLSIHNYVCKEIDVLA